MSSSENSKELATTEPTASTTVPISEMAITKSVLEYLTHTTTVPVRYQKDHPKASDTPVADMMAAILKGREVGLQPMEAISSLYLVGGRVALDGKTMLALVQRAGHQIRVQIAMDKATVNAWRRDPYTHELVDQGAVTFTKKDAETAGLADKDNYLEYPKMMLAWRAVTFACRLFFADTITGLAYVPEEVGIDAPFEEIPFDVTDDPADDPDPGDAEAEKMDVGRDDYE